jgi:4-hydroxybenzoyl-CoA thioesterase/acyl-CoA thioester hydrolase
LPAEPGATTGATGNASETDDGRHDHRRNAYDDGHDTMAPLTTRRRVEFRDTDAAGIVHFSAFFFWMESAEHELLRSAGIAVVDHGPNGIDASWPRVSATCDYVSAARFGEDLDIEVGVAAVGRTSVTYSFAFSHAGRSVARGRVVAVRCLMHPGRKPEAVPISAEIIARLEPYRSAT